MGNLSLDIHYRDRLSGYVHGERCVRQGRQQCKCPVSKWEGEKEEEGRADDDDDPAPRARRPRALFLTLSIHK